LVVLVLCLEGQKEAVVAGLPKGLKEAARVGLP
jgi:hypothetical protein